MDMDSERKRSFLLSEHQINREHADHINDQRQRFLEFYVGYIAAVLGLTQFLLMQNTNLYFTPLILPLLIVTLSFGIVSIFILSNYWVSRDYMRYRNIIAESEIQKKNPILHNYLDCTKAHCDRLPRLSSMFSLVSIIIIISNELILYLILRTIQTTMIFTIIFLGVLVILQFAIIFAYRYMLYGAPKKIFRIE